MAMTVQQVFNAALLDLGVIANGETPNPTESADGLAKLIQLLASWSLDPTLVLVVHRSFTPVAGTSEYTLGPGGSFNTNTFFDTQPLGVIGWRSKVGNFENNGRALSFPEFEAAVKDGAGTTAQLVQALCADRGAVIGGNFILVRIWPTPAASPGILSLDYWTALPTVAALSDSLSAFGPGYELAIRLNLAIELASSYGRPVDQALAITAQRALDSLRVLHAPGVTFPGPQVPAQ
jgi:hypothetical protein